MTATTYLVLLYGDEKQWKSMTPEQEATLDASHRAFTAALAERGYEQVSSAQLEYAAAGRIVRRRNGAEPNITDGPFAETVEQLGGFYLIRTGPGEDYHEDLTALVAKHLTESADIRPTV